MTANSTTPYISACTDLRKGPVVLELPAAGDVEDAWQLPAEVGPSGRDRGEGGKYLFTPPGYDGAVPHGCIHIPLGAAADTAARLITAVVASLGLPLCALIVAKGLRRSALPF